MRQGKAQPAISAVQNPFYEGSDPTAESLLVRAHDMLARAHIMVDGWQQAIDWHLDYLRWKKRMEYPEDPIRAANLLVNTRHDRRQDQLY